MVRGKEVSANWGGARKKAKKFATAEEIKGRAKENAKVRSDRKAALRARFLEQRERLEKQGKWQGSRRFEDLLLERGDEDLTRAARGVCMSVNSNLSCLNCMVCVDCVH